MLPERERMRSLESMVTDRAKGLDAVADGVGNVPMRFRVPIFGYVALVAGNFGAVLCTTGRAGDSWRQFRGLAAGHSEVKDLPLRWSETAHVKWKTPLPGEGWSSPVVANGQIWMTT